MTKTTKIFGSAGTGKTTKLLEFLKQEIKNGVVIEKIAAITFSKPAAQDFRNRVAKEFGRAEKELWSFCTLHALCKRILELKDVMKESDYQKIFSSLGIPYSMPKKLKNKDEDDEDALIVDINEDRLIGNVYKNTYDWLRLNLRDPTEPAVAPQFDSRDFDSGEYLASKQTIDEYKQTSNKVDFCDMLTLFLNAKLEPNFTVLFVDEFQDFAPLQYEVYKIFRDASERTFVAGDDDQTIYTFQGANAKYLLDEPAIETIILPKSYRHATRIHNYIMAFIGAVEKRQSKEVGTEREEEGSVSFKSRLSLSDLHTELPARAFFLFRTRKLVRLFGDILKREGHPFGFVKGQSIWGYRRLRFWNALCMRAGHTATFSEISAFLDLLPSKGFLLYGVKTKAKKIHEGLIKEGRGEAIKVWSDVVEFMKRDFETRELIAGARFSEITCDAMLARLERFGLKPIDYNKVPLLGTMHSSKGLEMDKVYVVLDLPFGVRKDFKEEDEYRVLFVAMSRARDELVFVENQFEDINYLEFLDFPETGNP